MINNNLPLGMLPSAQRVDHLQIGRLQSDHCHMNLKIRSEDLQQHL